MRLLLFLCFIPLFLTSCYHVDEIDLRLSGSAYNNPPVITNTTLDVIHTMVLPVDLTASDVEGSALTYTILSGPSNGTLLGSGASRTYVANEGFLGTDSFTYIASDGQKSSSIGTVTISVEGISESEGFAGPSAGTCLAFSSDGTSFVVGGSKTETTETWNILHYSGSDFKEVKVIDDSSVPIPGATRPTPASIAYSHDKSMIAAAGLYLSGGQVYGLVKLYRGENFEDVSVIDSIGPSGQYNSVAIAPDNSFILAAGLLGNNWVIKKFSGPDFTVVEVIENSLPLPGATLGLLSAMAMTPDGQSLVAGGTAVVAGSRHWLVKRYSGANFSQVDILDDEILPNSQISDISVSSNGRTIVVSGLLLVSSVYNLYLKKITDDNADGVYDISVLDMTSEPLTIQNKTNTISSDGSIILVGSWKNTGGTSFDWVVTKYSGPGHTIKTDIQTMTSGGTDSALVYDLAIAPDNTWFLSSGMYQGTTYTWLLRSGLISP